MCDLYETEIFKLMHCQCFKLTGYATLAHFFRVVISLVSVFVPFTVNAILKILIIFPV